MLLLCPPVPVHRAVLPASVFDPPPGLAVFFADWPEVWGWWAFAALQTFMLSLVLVGLWTRVATLSFAVITFAQASFLFSTGKIEHTLLYGWLFAAMAFAGWGRAYSVDAWRRLQTHRAPPRLTGRPLAWLALVVGLAMLSAALPKIDTGWLRTDTQAVRLFLTSAARRDTATPLGVWMLAHFPRNLWHALDMATVVVEASLVLLIVRLAWFRAGLLAVWAMHLGILLTMSISFAGNLMVYAGFFNYAPMGHAVARRIPDSWKSPPRHPRGVGMMTALAVTVVVLVARGFWTGPMGADLRPGVLRALEWYGMYLWVGSVGLIWASGQAKSCFHHR